MLKLYEYASSGNCYKIRLLLNQLEIAYQRIPIDILKGESRTAEFLTMNPVGKTPALEIQPGQYLFESNAIIYYLADGTDFLPADRWERAQVMQWLFFEQYSHEPNIATVRFWISIANIAEQKREAIVQKQELGYAALRVMEQHLERSDYFVGNRYTIADIALYAYTHVAEEGNFELSKFPAILAWCDRIAHQPNYLTILA
ncbi:glutathione S-transferase family protein [Chamaesiphon polymorphus]|uniref:Glutathione S-transferase n=1 Tax=Chamaesiphon polymorphus CCALA 037 TaxID=2107692 RepID=A0A2T1G437_9CYAN|nr:glutathione S-transferase family protein [Chamaesiphon polymorphus]PSB51995.1 glutathione S-transferase [Chamaesiphon polymorphus CCALA 037]